MRAPAIVVAIWAVVLACLGTDAHADYLVVSRTALIKEEPSSDAELIERASPGEHLQLLANGEQTNGYYRVFASRTQTEGWIYRTLARRHSGTSDKIPTREHGAQVGFDGKNCGKHLQLGIPHKSDSILYREGYAAGYNFTKKVPEWVSYRITDSSANGANVARASSFWADKEIPTEFRSIERDYERSGYDRGHMAPSASIDFSRKANDETFLYSNMTPQLAGFNRNMMGRTGVWGAIEDSERDWARERDELHIVAGTHFEHGHKTIGQGVGVPSNFFKIILDPTRMEAIAFWMPQDEDTRHLIAQYIESIDYIEERTGFDFFATLADEIEALLESSQADLAAWGGGH